MKKRLSLAAVAALALALVDPGVRIWRRTALGGREEPNWT